jgi:biopolymer transport protein ExbD
MRFQRTTRLFRGQLDLAPFLCVLFPVALAALLHSHLVLPRGNRIILPTSGAGPAVAPGEPTLILAIDKHQRLYFENQVTTPESLEQTLNRRARNNPASVLLVEADGAVSHGFLVGISELARRSGMREIVLSTLPAPAP